MFNWDACGPYCTCVHINIPTVGTTDSQSSKCLLLTFGHLVKTHNAKLSQSWISKTNSAPSPVLNIISGLITNSIHPQTT